MVMKEMTKTDREGTMGYPYKMSYTLRAGPPKPRRELTRDEGLTDILVVHSILGMPGEPGPLSVQTLRFGANGVSPVTEDEAFYLAAILLTSCPSKPSAVAALDILRRSIVGHAQEAP